MENLALAAIVLGASLGVEILVLLPTPENSIAKLFFRSVSNVRKFLICWISSIFASIWEQLQRFDRWADSEQPEPSPVEGLSDEWEDFDGHCVQTVPYSQNEIQGRNSHQNTSFEHESCDSNSMHESTEVMFSQEEVEQIKADVLRSALTRIRSINETYAQTIDRMAEEHDEAIDMLNRQHEQEIQQIEQQWKSTLQMTEHELRMRLSEQSREIDRLTRPDPHAHDKELFRQLQVMRGAGISRNQIVQRVLGGKLEGNSRAKYQRQYDDLIFDYGVDWLRELHSCGLSSQKIVKTVWGDFKDSSETDYIRRVEKAIEVKDIPDNVVPLHRIA